MSSHVRVGLFSLLILCILPSYLLADYLEVTRAVNLKTLPNSKASVLEKLQPETQVTILSDQQENGYYNVYSKDSGRSGWVYRTYVRRYPGEITVEKGVSLQEHPFKDESYFVSAEAKRYASRHLKIGKPQIAYERVYEGYSLGVDGRLKIPLWVQYELLPEDLDGVGKRRDNFHSDSTIPDGYRAEKSDYEKSGFDKGHMAPAGHMNRNQKVMDESFPLSNMAPQVGVGFNRHIWRYLETNCLKWCRTRGAITIITGPIFAVVDSTVSYDVIGDNEVAVPTHFYKIIVDSKDLGDVQALAFVLSNTRMSGEKDISKFLTSIDSIEKQTGLDFLTALPLDIQSELESKTAVNIW